MSLALAGAAVHAATPPPGFFGVGSWSYPSSAQSASLTADGLRLVRGALNWGVIQASASPASRNWSDPDRLAREAAADGYNLIFVLSGCADWACGTVNAPPTGPTLSSYEDFVAAAVARYDPTSSFWAGQRHVPTVTWQVWNEVNNGVTWPHPTPAAYATFLEQIATTIKGVDPHADVIMSGLDGLPTLSSGMTLPAFLNGLYAQPEFTASTAAIAVNAYAPTPGASLAVLDAARRVTLEHGDAARPMWVTEMGWATGGPPFPFTVSPTVQKDYLVESWDQMLACRARWNLQHVVWFALQDVSSAIFGPPDGWSYHDGLLNLDGSSKPAYGSFLDFVGFAPLPDGGGDACTLPGGLTLGSVDPHTRILSARHFTNNTVAQPIRFSAEEGGKPVAGMRYECSLDGAQWSACVSPLNAASKREGDHTLSVRGIDPEGNVDPAPASVTWLVDLTAPKTIISHLARPSRRRLRISFRGLDAGGIARFQCSIDARAWRTCSSPLLTARLATGRHGFAVRAFDRAGNVDRTPAQLRFTIGSG